MIHFFQNKPLQNFVNQSYQYCIYDKIFSKEINIKKLKYFILNMEKSTIKKYTNQYKELVKKTNWKDGLTGLGSNSLTSRMPFYNLLHFEEVEYLKDVIKIAHNDFLNELGKSYDGKLYIRCWANIMRKGQKINTHSHASNNFDYLSGHICVQTDNTSTYYMDPFYDNEIFSSKNIPGKITLFPSWTKHYTDTVTTNKERITIAFDIRYGESYALDIHDHKRRYWIQV